MESCYLENKEKEEKNQFKLIDKFKNLKSDYFLQQIFNNLETKKLLDIVKYNNNIKKRINININNYKEYSEKYSLIEIEIAIKPANNKSGNLLILKKKIKNITIYILIIMKKK